MHRGSWSWIEHGPTTSHQPVVLPAQHAAMAAAISTTAIAAVTGSFSSSTAGDTRARTGGDADVVDAGGVRRGIASETGGHCGESSRALTVARGAGGW